MQEPKKKYDDLSKILFDFFTSIVNKLNSEIELLNFDGRVNNVSKRNITLLSDSKNPLNCLNCYSNKYGYLIETMPINKKINEIPTIENR